MSFEVVSEFEQKIAKFYGSPYAVAVDCCTHAIELCLRYKEVKKYTVPPNTYPSVPNLAQKIGIEFEWEEQDWKDYYYLGGTNIIDGAVYWKRDGYVPNSLMCLSFQFKKHLSLGRGGMILTDDYDAAHKLTQMSYDGRIPNVPWREQNIDTIGYHYYMTPETAKLGIKKFIDVVNKKPKQWVIEDWPDLSRMEIFR